MEYKAFFLFLLNAAHASCFLLLMSSEVPSKLPKYLQFFQLWSDVLLMLYSSVLSALTIRFLLVRILGTVFFHFFFGIQTCSYPRKVDDSDEPSIEAED